jgi:hypothetical protein
MDKLGKWYEAKTFREVFGPIADRTQHIPALTAAFAALSVVGGATAGTLVYYAPTAFAVSQAVTWSGVPLRVAQDVANMTGGTLLNGTFGGRVVSILAPLIGHVSKYYESRLWIWASAQYVRQAERVTAVLGETLRAGATWTTTEAPILYQRGIEVMTYYYRGP